MSIRTMVENRIWDESKSEWIITAPKTHAAAVETSDGSTVQSKLDAIPQQITNAKDGAAAEIRGGVAAEGDTLAKLHTLITALQELVKSDEVNLDTVQEIVDYIKTNRDDLTLMGTNKVDYDDIVNNLTTVSTVEGKVLDARQGKVLKDLIDALLVEVAALRTHSEEFVTQNELNIAIVNVSAAARVIISNTPPANPVDGQLWLKPAGTIEI